MPKKFNEGATMTGKKNPDTKISASAREAASKGAKDTLSRSGAMQLARRLEKFWHDRGFHAARFWAEPITERFAKVGTYEIYRVVCNLVNGLPPRYRED
jgi:hypothetical protein